MILVGPFSITTTDEAPIFVTRVEYCMALGTVCYTMLLLVWAHKGDVAEDYFLKDK